MANEKEVNVIVDAKNKAGKTFLEVKRGLEEMGQAAKKGAGSVVDYMGRADNVLYKFSDRLKFMDSIAKRTFQGAAGASALYLASTLRSFSEIQDGLSKVNTMYDQTAASQDKMVHDSINMFRLLPTDFEKITQGMYDSISAGADPKYAAMLSRKFGMGAVAGITDLPVVTKAAMGTMNAFGKEVKDLDHILDVQFKTVKAGIVEYEQLASSLGTGVLKSAEGAGMSIEELYAAIAQITKNAIPANIATTSLVQLFNKFTSTKAIKEFKEFGVDIRNAKNETRPLVEIMKDLNDQFDKRKMTNAQRAGYLKELLGSDEAARALQPLLGDLKSFDKILKDMQGSSGAMMDAFDDRLNNMGTQLKLFWNNMKAAGIEQMYTLKPLMDSITEPMISKQKLEFQKMNLEDALNMTNDPQEKKMLRVEIEDIQKQINGIDLSPVEKFREALSQSVKELEKINPPLAKFLDTIGNFTLNFVGEEGEGARNWAEIGGKGLLTVYAVKKGVDAFSWINKNFPSLFGGKNKGTSLGESLVKTMQSMNVNAGVVNVFGKTGLPTNAPGKPVIFDQYGKPIPTNIPTSPGKGLPVNPIPTAGKGALDLLKTGAKVVVPVAIAAGLVYTVKKAWDEDPQSFIDRAHKETDRRSDRTPRNERQRNYTKSEENASINSTLLREQKNLVAEQLLGSLKDMDNFNRNLSLQNLVQVDAPKVNIQLAIDGKSIPFKATIDYEKMDRHQYRQSIRHGRSVR